MKNNSISRLHSDFARTLNFICRNLEWFSEIASIKSHSFFHRKTRRRLHLFASELRQLGLEALDKSLIYNTASGFVFKQLIDRLRRLPAGVKELAEYGNKNKKIEVLPKIWELKKFGRLASTRDLEEITYSRNLHRSLERLQKLNLVKKFWGGYLHLTDMGMEVIQNINKSLDMLNNSFFIVRSPFEIYRLGSEHSVHSALKRSLSSAFSRYGGRTQILIYVPSRMKNEIKPAIRDRNYGFDVIVDVDLTYGEIKGRIPIIFDPPLPVRLKGIDSEICGANIETKLIKFSEDKKIVLEDKYILDTLLDLIMDKDRIAELNKKLHTLTSPEMLHMQEDIKLLFPHSHLLCRHKYYRTILLSQRFFEGVSIKLFLHPAPWVWMHR